MNMIKDILSSDLRPIEKMVLTIEWFLREQKPCELYDKRLVDIQREVDTVVEKQMPPSLIRMAFKDAKEIFKINDDAEISPLLVALSFYSYVDNEFAYDYNTRRELLLKLSELGFSSSRFQRLNDKWNRIVGSSEALFNRSFRKQLAKPR